MTNQQQNIPANKQLEIIQQANRAALFPRPPQEWQSVTDPEPFPIDALPDVMKSAVLQAVDNYQSPIEIPAWAALSELAAVGQCYVDVVTSKDPMPSGLYLGCIAESGTGKSIVTKQFHRIGRTFEKNVRERHVGAWRVYDKELKKYQKEDGGGEPPDRKPKIRIKFESVTPERRVERLANECPIGYTHAPEGGKFFNGKEMNTKENKEWATAFHSDVFTGDGGGIETKTQGSVYVAEGTRCTIGVMPQGGVFDKWIEDGIAITNGLAARIIWAKPTVTFIREEERDGATLTDKITAYGDRVLAIDEKNKEKLIFHWNGDAFEIKPHPLQLSKESDDARRDLHNSLVDQLQAGMHVGLHSFAQRVAENSSRMAALFELLDQVKITDKMTVSLANFERAQSIVQWAFDGLPRIFKKSVLSPVQKAAQKLEAIILKNGGECNRTVAMRSIGSNNRNEEYLTGALAVLVAMGRAVEIPSLGSKEKTIILHPQITHITQIPLGGFYD